MSIWEKRDQKQCHDDVFLVGTNGSNEQKERKIVWAGRLHRLMTFECAYNTLTSEPYETMRRLPHSPLHLKPLYDQDGQFEGYEHRSSMHTEDGK